MTVGIKKLIKVDGGENNNKFYQMTPNGDTFEAYWGRVEGGKGEKQTYPISAFEKKYKEKLRKGYKDVTDIVAVVQTTGTSFSDIKDSEVSKLVAKLQGYSNTSIKENYTVSALAVTQRQVDEAQTILNNLIKSSDFKEANGKLEELYTVIPRKMKKVSDHLIEKGISGKALKEGLSKIITDEQATLDVMAGQVSANITTKDHKKTDTLLEAMGLNLSSKVDSKEIDLIRKLLGSNSGQYKNAYKVINNKTQTRFEKHLNTADNKHRKLFWHGSRNENWWSIIGTGLQLRPTNAVISGKMFGYGIYFADKAQKSIGYTSLSGSYWARGNANSAYLALFDVHLGEMFHTKRHDSYMSSLDWNKLRARGKYDSLFAEGGYDLRNNEYIVYQEPQCTIAYIVEIGN